MDENEPLEWYERLILQVVVGLMILAVPVFYLLMPVCILLGILAWVIVLPILSIMETLESRHRED